MNGTAEWDVEMCWRWESLVALESLRDTNGTSDWEVEVCGEEVRLVIVTLIHIYRDGGSQPHWHDTSQQRQAAFSLLYCTGLLKEAPPLSILRPSLTALHACRFISCY